MRASSRTTWIFGSREFGSLSLGDEVFGDLRWVDLHLRRGDTDLALGVIDSARERALRAGSPEMLFLVDAWEAVFRVRLAHDRTDRQVRELTRRGRAALGGEVVAAAYGKGWGLDGKTAVAEADPARLRRELGAAHPDSG